MLEILFKGKRVDNGEWVYGLLWRAIDKKTLVIGYAGDFDEVIPKSVGQYTGKKDKYGKEIFGKHIVKVGGGSCFYGEITYSHDTASFWVENKRLEYYIPLGELNTRYLEIIGNAIDNPKLLEGGYYSGKKSQISVDEVGVKQASVKKGTKLYYHCYDDIEGERHLCEVPDVVTAVMSEGFFVSTRTDSDGVFEPDKDVFFYWSAIGEEYFLTIQDAEQSMKECEENATTGRDQRIEQAKNWKTNSG